MLSTGELCDSLIEYLSNNIIPQYDNFDSAHHRDHADAVIRNSMELAKHYDVDLNMIYTVAAYHDTGLCIGREKHHIKSGEILREDKELLRWFSKNQLKTMSEAVEDHRASLSGEPRSIYGKIVAEADRDINPLKIIRRTVQYGIDNYPELDKEEHWLRAVEHLKDKYGEGGYLKTILPESNNTVNLKELRKIIADPEELRKIFDDFYSEEKS
ncbi:MAG: HD domain-containing protein [Bacteroidales bacterium]|nr:HD domain-containing protein [Bacteroidales bacterium]